MKVKDQRAEIRNKSDKDLLKAIADSREELRKIRFGTTGSKKALAQKSLKRNIARALTELKNREN